MGDLKLTSKDFKMPLIKVLGILTNYKADSPVNLQTVYEPVCESMKITIDQFGDNPSTNSPWVEKWIQWAFKELRNEGYAKTMGRGQWALTEAGAKIMSNQTLSPVTNQTNQDDDSKVSTPLTFSKIQPENAYHDDPYIRALATQKATCFGAYAQQSKVCENCPINSSCTNATMAELVIISRRLMEADIKEQNKKDGIPENPKKFTLGSNEKMNMVQIHQTSICSGCGKVIQKGTIACWISSSTGESAGLYHPECFEDKK